MITTSPARQARDFPFVSGRALGPWRRASTLAAALCLVAVGACDDGASKKKASAPAAPSEEVEDAEPVKAAPQGPPEFSIDEVSPRIGFARAVVMKPDGKPNPEGLEQLRQKLAEVKTHVAQQTVRVRVHRQAKPAWVTTYLNELGKLGPERVEIETETRPDYPATIRVVPETQLDSPPKCSLVGMILADRGSAIWRLSGGTARKRGRGMGGPDLTMTGDTILSMAKGCPDSSSFFATAADDVEWGLLYDLAASAVSLEKAGLSHAVFPSQPAVAGHPLELAK